MAKEGSFSINVNRAEKTVDLVIVGTFTPEQVQEFVSDYTTKAKSINASEFTLNADSTDMDVLTQEMVPALENTIRMYQQTGFEKLVVSIKKNPILKMQLNRIFKNTGFTNAEVKEI
ncbi:hypothetical protein EKG37_06330 [Robertmurraya yapensis]|uniref:STAS domain-containing protein n=2 Tax=Bacillaceae TaxID=186817 RepID=A0A3S0KML2_9BACI|nr:hypothetical protein [Bacillus yapensis]RTR33835.1 hypothetical protein EKG37_06330 [Bacillus yapensis]TKS97153.1 hypothetical protein FAR12_06330 [Bacillus yapensis]